MQGLGLEMLAAAARFDVSCRSSAPAWLARAEEMLRAEFLSGADMGAVAAAADVHPAHLARAFRKYYRESIGSFVRRCVIHAAGSQQGRPVRDTWIVKGF